MERQDTDPVLLLLVDDDADCRALLSTLLTLERYRVVTAANGAEGLVLARQYMPSLVLLDLMMPVLDGVGFREAQLADPAIRDIPVIVLSAAVGAQAQASTMGAKSFIEKPIVFDNLTEQVAAHCRPNEP